jgi:tetratricopeptide (TPR) repeat protein
VRIGGGAAGIILTLDKGVRLRHNSPGMAVALTPSEVAQLAQTIEMFEVITQSQPLDYASLEILKEAYLKLGRQHDVVNTSKRIAQAYVQLGQLSSAILEYEGILQQFPADPDVRAALAEIESRASSLASTGGETELLGHVPQPITGPPARPAGVDDGRAAMRKLFVDGKLIGSAEFDQFWSTPDPETPPLAVQEPFIQLLAERGLVPAERSLKLLIERVRLPFIPLEMYDVDVEVARSFPRVTCLRWCILPFDRMSKSVLVATANPFNKQVTWELENATKSHLIWYLTHPGELKRLIQKFLR